MSQTFRLLARNEKGKLAFDDPIHFRAVLTALPARVSVTLERERQIRSLQANSYYWACIVPLVAAVLSVGRDVPLSNDQVHIVLKSAFLGVEETSIGPVPKSTRGLSKEEFATYCEKIMAHFTQETGVDFPQPGERTEVSA